MVKRSHVYRKALNRYIYRAPGFIDSRVPSYTVLYHFEDLSFLINSLCCVYERKREKRVCLRQVFKFYIFFSYILYLIVRKTRRFCTTNLILNISLFVLHAPFKSYGRTIRYSL